MHASRSCEPAALRTATACHSLLRFLGLPLPASHYVAVGKCIRSRNSSLLVGGLELLMLDSFRRHWSIWSLARCPGKVLAASVCVTPGDVPNYALPIALIGLVPCNPNIHRYFTQTLPVPGIRYIKLYSVHRTRGRAD